MARDRDLADVVQELRQLRWKVALGLKEPPAHAVIDLLDIDGITVLVTEPRALEDAVALEISDDYERLAAEFRTDPRVPVERKLVMRYVRGEIGHRTVRFILNIDSFELVDLCRRHGLPPLHGALALALDE